MSRRNDAVVIGAGHNGLTAALTLAAADRRVLVLERSSVVGGLCAPLEFAPGFRVPGVLPDTSGFRSQLIDELDLVAHGLKLRTEEPPILVALGGEGRLLNSSAEAMRSSGLADEDVAAYTEWREFLASVSPFVHRVLDSPPPRLDLADAGLSRLGELTSLAASGWALRRLGRETATEMMRLLPMCVADWLGERFRSEGLATALAAPALFGSYNGPWAAGSAAALIFRECVAGRSVVGGPTALIDALRTACEAKGVEIRVDSEVEAISLDSGRVAGVRLASGESHDADTVLATCNPKTTLLDLVGPRFLDATTEREMGNFRCRGTTAIMLLAVDGEIEVAAHPGAPIERLRLGAATFDDLERAFDAVKYGRASAHPYIEVWIPSIENPALAPAGGHVVAALVSCAPYDLADGWSTFTREALIQSAVHQINDHIPGIRDHLAGGRLLAPPDLEQQLALPGGHLLHGEPALDQLLFLRPSLHLSRYTTPIGGLFLGGSGSHPGGGITGMPGRLGAQAALAA